MCENNIDRSEYLKLEIELLQTRFDKFDDFSFRNRNWFLTIWSGLITVTFIAKIEFLPYIAIIICFLYWSSEGLIRYKYWYRFVPKYRLIRDLLNTDSSDINSIDLLDLTCSNDQNIVKKYTKNKFRNSFFRIELVILYGGMIILSLLIGFIICKLNLFN